MSSESNDPASAAVSNTSTAEETATPALKLEAFNFISVLSRDVFSKVMLAEAPQSRKLYAVKVLDKSLLVENNEVHHIHAEKNVLLVANRERQPFLTRLHGSFQTKTHVFFITDYIEGGSLETHLQLGAFSPQQARFYAAEICLALKGLHDQGILYRNLKLDGILLTRDGHIKMTNFGLCKENIWHGSTTRTWCGTAEFMAPELLLNREYGRAVDWWGFGVILYQMLLRTSPFRGEDEDEIYDSILEDDLSIPFGLVEEAASILRKLLVRDPGERLGNGPTDAQEIMSHPYFRNITWDDVYQKKVPVPFLPTIKDKFDMSNFDKEYTSLPTIIDSPHSTLPPHAQREFEKFDYVAASPREFD